MERRLSKRSVCERREGGKRRKNVTSWVIGACYFLVLALCGFDVIHLFIVVSVWTSSEQSQISACVVSPPVPLYVDVCVSVRHNLQHIQPCSSPALTCAHGKITRETNLKPADRLNFSLSTFSAEILIITDLLCEKKLFMERCFSQWLRLQQIDVVARRLTQTYTVYTVGRVNSTLLYHWCPWQIMSAAVIWSLCWDNFPQWAVAWRWQHWVAVFAATW